MATLFNTDVASWGMLKDVLRYVHNALAKLYPRHQSREFRIIFEDQTDGTVKLKMQAKKTSEVEWTTLTQPTAAGMEWTI
jgi:hypothetical protein